jgi:hypothetical protein
MHRAAGMRHQPEGGVLIDTRGSAPRERIPVGAFQVGAIRLRCGDSAAAGARVLAVCLRASPTNRRVVTGAGRARGSDRARVQNGYRHTPTRAVWTVFGGLVVKPKAPANRRISAWLSRPRASACVAPDVGRCKVHFGLRLSQKNDRRRASCRLVRPGRGDLLGASGGDRREAGAEAEQEPVL